MAQLIMKRPALGGTESPEPAAGPMLVRAATSRDAEALAVLFKAAFPEMEWDAARVHRDLFDAEDVKATFVAEEDGHLLGTASARYFERRFAGVGYVHWVAVDPAARGRGAFDAVMAAVHRQFLADGRSTAFLETDDHRLPAITAYLRLGYVPQYTDPDHELRWSQIFAGLAQARRAARNSK